MSRCRHAVTVRGVSLTFWMAGAVLSAISCRDNDIAGPEDVGSARAEGSALATSSTTALTFRQVSAGVGQYSFSHTCGVTTDDRVYCWGSNYSGQLGIGTNTGPERCSMPAEETRACSTRPVAVLGGLRFRQVSAGWAHTCGVALDYRAYCWGANFAGQLGDGTTTARLRPVLVAGGLKFRQVDAGDAGGYGHTCGVSYTDNRAYCWGFNSYGQLGDRTITTRLRPVAVAGGHLFRQVSVGGWHTCGVTTANAAFCWGWNRYGQLGDSTEVGHRQQPSRVAGARQFRQLDAGARHTCAVTTSDRAFCWGDGRGGQIGNGRRYLSFWPRAVSGGLSFGRVTAGEWHTCGETTTNRAYCWGFGRGLGNGTTTLALTPVAVAGGLFFSQVSAGTDYTCGKTSAAVAYCWGNNGSGELGDGTEVERLTPTPVAGAM
jgi:alpha-tubulin suppressor-like RCC1 family protein